MTTRIKSDLYDRVQNQKWFYEFDLPNGQKTQSFLPQGIEKIHGTRLNMLWLALNPLVNDEWSKFTAIDIACNQGFFASHLARKGCQDVLAVDARSEHIASTRLIADVYELKNLRTLPFDVNANNTDSFGTFDICIIFGLLYHVENPVGLLRLARKLTRKVCIIETQVVPNLTGVVDWGAHQFVRPIIGSIGIIDEIAETNALEASTTGICLCPSFESLCWLMLKVGFNRVEKIMPPTDSYEQHVSFKRVMVVGYVD